MRTALVTTISVNNLPGTLSSRKLKIVFCTPAEQPISTEASKITFTGTKTKATNFYTYQHHTASKFVRFCVVMWS